MRRSALVPLVLVLAALLLLTGRSGLTLAQEATPGLAGLQIGSAATPSIGALQIVAPTPEPATPAAGVAGSAYASPTFGYSLRWGAPWRVVAAASEGGTDTLTLANGTSRVTVTGRSEASPDPAACVERWAAGLQSGAGVRDARPARGADGQPLRGGDAERAYAIFTYTDATGAPIAEYHECRALPSGRAVLDISHVAPLDAFNAEVVGAQALLAALDLAPPATPAAATPAVAQQEGTREAANEAVVRGWYAEVIAAGNAAAADRFLAPDFVRHQPPPGGAQDRAAYLSDLAGLLDSMRVAFPDLQVQIDDLIASGDKVVVRATYRGAHLGALADFPPTSNAVAMEEIAIFRLAGGRIAESWGLMDELGLLHQIGGELVVPTPTAAVPTAAPPTATALPTPAAPPTATPPLVLFPTAVPTGVAAPTAAPTADCVAIRAWVDEMRPRVLRERAIEGELTTITATDPGAAGRLRALSAEFAGMAAAQRAAPAPEAARAANDDLAAAFTAYAQGLEGLATAIETGNNVAANQAVGQLTEGDRLLTQAGQAIGQLAGGCGIQI